MSDVGEFIDKESIHERRLAEFMQWQFVEEQEKGSSYDYVASDGSKIEAKFDWDSIKTGNHYLEIAQTNDNKVTWFPSGFSLSSKSSDYWVVINEDWLRIFQIEVLMNYIQNHRASLIQKETRSGINYNSQGQYSKAYIIPFTKLDKYCLAKIPNPIDRTKS